MRQETLQSIVKGTTNEPEEEYDLMEVIMIRKGNVNADDAIFQYLESVFESDIERIKKYIDIPKDSEIEKEITRMTGLGESLYNKAYKEATIKLLKKNYKRNPDVELMIQDLKEVLKVNYEDAKEIFEREIKN